MEPPGFRGRLLGATLAGGLTGGLAAIALALGGGRAWLARGGWWLAIFAGASVGAFAASRWAANRGERTGALLVGAALLLAAVGIRVESPAEQAQVPRGARATARALLRWSYESPRAVARILPYARDPNPTVREQAVLALGVNRVVSDLERSPADGKSPLTAQLRDSLRAALLTALVDSVETVRAQAGRALWKAPRAFGAQPAAAETLAAILVRALAPGATERLAWLALDAAAGAPHPALKSAAARVAMTTADSDLARAARRAAGSTHR